MIALACSGGVKIGLCFYYRSFFTITRTYIEIFRKSS